jgi:hypothetical protein
MAGRIGCLVLIVAALAAIYYFGSRYVRMHPQDVPWTKLSLADPVGRFTLRKIVKLHEQPQLCRALLSENDVRDTAVPLRDAPAECRIDNGMRLVEGGARTVGYQPEVVTSCPVAAALAVLEDRVIQPAAGRHLGSRVVAIDHFGSYSCRRVNGRSQGEFSEHATANAIDIAGFRLADGRRITVSGDWSGNDPGSRFLHAVRDGACKLFATVLSPDYNAAHADHLHLDEAVRGLSGWSFCR